MEKGTGRRKGIDAENMEGKDTEQPAQGRLSSQHSAPWDERDVNEPSIPGDVTLTRTMCPRPTPSRHGKIHSQKQPRPQTSNDDLLIPTPPRHRFPHSSSSPAQRPAQYPAQSPSS